MKILAAQINPVIGDLSGNTDQIVRAIGRAKEKNTDLVIFPELAICGYPPEDFMLMPHFISSISTYLDMIVEATRGIAAVIGLPRYNPHKHEKRLHNSAVFICDRTIVDYADKILLPTYDVFDERRYFSPGTEVKVWDLSGQAFGVTICEDLWQHSGLVQESHYPRDPIIEMKGKRPSFLINISASPFSLGKFRSRMEVSFSAARTLECPVVFCNQVGGNDSLIFDGNSFVADSHGLLQCAKSFAEDDLLIDTSMPKKHIVVEQNSVQDLHRALVLGIRDYFKKLSFHKACLGLSGGIDSAVVACLAVEALGCEHVLALSMPSRYTSSESIRDAKLLAKNLGVELREISIEEPFECFLHLLAPSFAGKEQDTTEENLQARIRGMILMAFSNKFGHLLLSTGNKSELALGYSTLYGDMCGGLAVLGDVTKQQVFALANQFNQHEELIPWHVIKRAPSAELRANQKDSDSLPSYEVIDNVLCSYVEEHRSPAWIAEHFHYPLELVLDLVKKIHMNEYKRRQSPPSLRVSEKSFSIGRKFPIVQKWV